MPEDRCYTIWGGEPLVGEIAVAGAKNAAPKLIIASLLSEQPSILENVPRIGEVELTLRICDALGVRWRWLDQTTLEVDPSTLTGYRVPRDVSLENRCCVIFMAVLLRRLGAAAIEAIGGDAIGRRPIDFHLQGLQALGATVEHEDAATVFRCERLIGASTRLDYPSVGATEQLLLAAAGAEGRTVIHNAAVEPEIQNLVGFLQAMGATIYQEAGRTWIVDGVAEFRGVRYRVIDDRLEAASYAAAAVATRGDVFVRGARQEHMMSFLNALRAVGGAFDVDAAGIRFRANGTLRKLIIETDAHPGFMTDWQPPMVVLLTQAEGVSIVHETVYEDRLGYVAALGQMGAEIALHTSCLGNRPCRYRDRDCLHSAVIQGPTQLYGRDLSVPDLRAGFAYLLAALVAEGETNLCQVDNIDRGYEAVLDKIRCLGGNVEERRRRPGTAPDVLQPQPALAPAPLSVGGVAVAAGRAAMRR